MAEKTKNYNLIKPGLNDFYNIEDFNKNVDIVDEELKKAHDKLTISEENQVKGLNLTFKVTGTINIPSTAQTIEVSPNMGLKIIEE